MILGTWVFVILVVIITTMLGIMQKGVWDDTGYGCSLIGKAIIMLVLLLLALVASYVYIFWAALFLLASYIVDIYLVYKNEQFWTQ